ncbi:MAG: hypothetical protein ABIS17_07340 [Casimicrobiaceae bacterium]
MQPIETVWEPTRVFLLEIGHFLPRALIAVAIVVVGWLIAKALRFAVVKALRAINFHVLTERAGLDGFLRQGGGSTDTVVVLGLLVYWLVLLTAFMIGFNSIGLTYVTDLVGRIVLFVPRVMLAVVIIAFGAYFGRFIGRSVSVYCKNAGIADGDLLGRLATYAVVVFVLLIALDQLGVGELIRESFLIILAALALALALAFGLGGRKRAEEFLDRWRPVGPDDPRRPGSLQQDGDADAPGALFRRPESGTTRSDRTAPGGSAGFDRFKP